MIFTISGGPAEKEVREPEGRFRLKHSEAVGRSGVENLGLVLGLG